MRLAKDGVRREYYSLALADKAVVQCFLGKYDEALLAIDEALVQPELYSHNPDLIMDNRCSILVLAGAFEDALKLLQVWLDQHPKDDDLRFSMATCLLHMERYDEAAAAYEQAMAKDKDWKEKKAMGLRHTL